jgi:hypothetical protein
LLATGGGAATMRGDVRASGGARRERMSGGVVLDGLLAAGVRVLGGRGMRAAWRRMSG